MNASRRSICLVSRSSSAAVAAAVLLCARAAFAQCTSDGGWPQLIAPVDGELDVPTNGFVAVRLSNYPGGRGAGDLARLALGVRIAGDAGVATSTVSPPHLNPNVWPLRLLPAAPLAPNTRYEVITGT